MESKRECVFMDWDGCIQIHSYDYINKEDYIAGAIEQLLKWRREDKFIVLTTARAWGQLRQELDNLFKISGFKFDDFIYNLPTGTRTLYNDDGKDGECKAFCFRRKRNGKWKMA